MSVKDTLLVMIAFGAFVVSLITLVVTLIVNVNKK
ncbi:putative holin-like toxin [Schleiferilactobacillus shenzhenensis]